MMTNLFLNVIELCIFMNFFFVNVLIVLKMYQITYINLKYRIIKVLINFVLKLFTFISFNDNNVLYYIYIKLHTIIIKLVNKTLFI